MKKLSKIKLHEADVMTDSEMKFIFGGTGSSDPATGATTGLIETGCENKNKDECNGQECNISTKIKGTCTWNSDYGSCGCKKHILNFFH